MTRPKLSQGCCRSHPHERMNGYCKLKTEIARLNNENARMGAVLREIVEADRQNRNAGSIGRKMQAEARMHIALCAAIAIAPR